MNTYSVKEWKRGLLLPELLEDYGASVGLHWKILPTLK